MNLPTPSLWHQWPSHVDRKSLYNRRSLPWSPVYLFLSRYIEKHQNELDALGNFDSSLENVLNNFIQNKFTILGKQESGQSKIIKLNIERDSSNETKKQENEN